MGKPDTITKEYMRRPDIFADVFNKFLYHGRQVIDAGDLVELDTTEIAVPYGTDKASVPEQRYRDVAKALTTMTDGTAAYCILAVENESKVNYAMPVKDGLYDFLQLAHQVTTAAASHRETKSEEYKPSGGEFLSGFWKSDRLIPVVTLVVYFGAGEWDGPLSLKEMYAECSAEILRYAADYRINLLAPGNLSDEEIDEFQGSMREVMRYIKYSGDRKKLNGVVSAEPRFKNMERSAAEVINVATGSRMKIAEGGEVVDMCLAIKEMREESMTEGEIKGVITFAHDFGIPKDEAKKFFMVKYKKNDDEAEELLKMYWK